MEKVVSVIIPVYNVEEFIFKTVKSVMDQDYKKWRTFVRHSSTRDRDKERDRYRVRKRGRVKGTSPRPQLWQI